MAHRPHCPLRHIRFLKARTRKTLLPFLQSPTAMGQGQSQERHTIIEAIQSPVVTPAQSKRQHLRDQLHVLALAIGLRPAARKLGINEHTATVWSHRYKWRIADYLSSHARTSQDPKKSNEVTAHTALKDVIDEQGEDTRLYLSAASLKSAYHAATLEGRSILEKETSQALLNTARTADVVHGYTAARQQGVSVQIANVIMPTEEEKAQRKAIDAKLDEITRRLVPPGGGDQPKAS